jgi:hypothetical protein
MSDSGEVLFEGKMPSGHLPPKATNAQILEEQRSGRENHIIDR